MINIRSPPSTTCDTNITTFPSAGRILVIAMDDEGIASYHDTTTTTPT